MSEDQRPPDDSEPTRLDSTDLASDPDSTREAGGTPGDRSTVKRLGDFELLRELGRGGMGVVYAARQVSLDRRVALKVLPPAMGLTSQAKQRFQREARAAAKLHHTNIVPVHAVGEHEGHHFYAMELIEGQSLDHVLRQVVDEGTNALMEATVTQMLAEIGPRPATPNQDKEVTSLSDTSARSREWFDTVAELMADVADGLHYAHGRGIIHRDIKPANLMLSKEGHLCVTDFGLARVLQEPGITVTGSFLGTPAYMSPEQIAAGRIKVDHRTDVYSLGVVLYEMLTLERPFHGESREEILNGVLTKEPRPLRRINTKIPVDLETICLKAMEKEPERRYRAAGELANDLRQYLQHGLIAARRAGLLLRAAKWARRHPVAATAGGLAVVFAVVVAGVVWINAQRSAAARVERLLLEGRLALEAGMYREGVANVDRALSIDPQSDGARILKAKFLPYAGNRRMVMEDAKARLALDPEDWVSHLIVAFAGSEWLEMDYSVDVRGHVEALKGAPESADLFHLRSLVADSAQEQLHWLDRALELEPNHPQALDRRYIVLMWTLMDIAEAFRICERIIVAHPKSEFGYTLKAFGLNSVGDYDGAIETVNKAIELDPGEAHAYWTRGHIYKTNGKYRESIPDFTKAIELRPQRSIHYRRRAQAYDALGEYDKALVDARKAVEINPNYPENWRALFTVLLDLKDENQIRTAAGELRERIGTWYDWSDYKARTVGFNQLSRVYRELGDHEQALSDATRAIELHPAGLTGYVNRLRVRQQRTGKKSIQEDCDRLAALDIENVDEDLTRAAHLASTCSRPDQALDTYTRIIGRAPDYWRAYGDRGKLRFKEKHFEAALSDYEKATKLAPKQPGMLNRYAWALLFSEPSDLLDPDKALDLTLQANEIAGFDNPDYLKTLAHAYHLTGDAEMAVETQRRAISLLPEGADRSEYEERLAEFEAALQDRSK
jgi:serine/threonine protein kinase/Tfp pilus assembly protein PilF